MKATLLSDIERGFDSLKSKLDFAPKVNQIEAELKATYEEQENIKKSQASAVKALYTCHSNLIDRLQQTKDELETRF